MSRWAYTKEMQQHLLQLLALTKWKDHVEAIRKINASHHMTQEKYNQILATLKKAVYGKGS